VKVISADTVKRRIMDEFKVKQNELKNLLINLDSKVSYINYKVSFTTDCWTCSNNISFMGLTGHWIDKDWKLHATTLDFLHLGKSHTGIHLYEFLMADGSSFRSFHHIRCFAHVLNLGAQAALNVLWEDLELLRNMIKKIRSSPLSEEKFRSFQVDRTLKPILDVATRWSTKWCCR
jgi:hypothetical protein